MAETLSSLSFFGKFLSFILCIIVVFLAYELAKLFRYQRSNIAWVAITLAMAVMAMRRALDLASSFNDVSLAKMLMADYEWVFLSATSAILLYAFWKIKSGFAEERRVEEETMMRIRKFESRIRKKALLDTKSHMAQRKK